MISQFPRTTLIPLQSPKYWAKEKDRYIRQLLISDIQELTQRPLVVYFAQLDQTINHTDPDDLSEILSDITVRYADIIIQTPGGNVDAAEKLVGILKHKLDSWRIIVPSWAKSAGTVIALSAQEIIMGVNSELGPIDPQWIANGISIPCDILGNDPTQPFHIREMAKMFVQRNKALAKDLLETGMMQDQEESYIEEALAKISSASGYNSHGAVIDYEEAKSIGLSVNYLDYNDELWKKIWLLYCLYDYDTKAKGIGRVIEGVKLSIARPK
ncbi:MAG TPA: hypothetical protein VN374_04320 [Desulfitobacteriaceae bacterium]|nr:hypothetical protein [Desulfitobacteriaceae bacterium]